MQNDQLQAGHTRAIAGYYIEAAMPSRRQQLGDVPLARTPLPHDADLFFCQIVPPYPASDNAELCPAPISVSSSLR
jgi:hypothetical protein